MKIDTLYFKISDFIIALTFHQENRPFLLSNIKNNIIKFYHEFLISDSERNISKPNFTIEFHSAKYLKISYDGQKRFINYYDKKSKKKFIVYDHISIAQFQFILLKLLLNLYEKKTVLLLHASAVNIDNNAYIFIGRQSSGKSTIIKLLKNKYQALADDTVIIRKFSGRYYFYQTPFVEKESWVIKSPKRYYLGKIFLIKKSKTSTVRKIIDKNIIFQNILNNVLPEWNHLLHNKQQIGNLLDFSINYPYFYELKFNKNQSCLTKLLNKSKLA